MEEQKVAQDLDPEKERNSRAKICRLILHIMVFISILVGFISKPQELDIIILGIPGAAITVSLILFLKADAKHRLYMEQIKKRPLSSEEHIFSLDNLAYDIFALGFIGGLVSSLAYQGGNSIASRHLIVSVMYLFLSLSSVVFITARLKSSLRELEEKKARKEKHNKLK